MEKLVLRGIGQVLGTDNIWRPEVKDNHLHRQGQLYRNPLTGAVEGKGWGNTGYRLPSEVK